MYQGQQLLAEPIGTLRSQGAAQVGLLVPLRLVGRCQERTTSMQRRRQRCPDIPRHTQAIRMRPPLWQTWHRHSQLQCAQGILFRRNGK